MSPGWFLRQGIHPKEFTFSAESGVVCTEEAESRKEFFQHRRFGCVTPFQSMERGGGEVQVGISPSPLKPKQNSNFLSC